MKLQLALLPVMASIALFSCSKPVQEKGKSPFDVLEETYKGPIPHNTVLNKKEFHRSGSDRHNSSRNAEETTTENLSQKNILSTEEAMDSLYSAIDKKPQVFTINATKESTFICAEGTIIKVPAFAFSDYYRRPVYGTVVLEVKEYYALEDMLFAGLHSVGDGNLLESNGMLSVRARQDNMELRLAGDKHLTVKMPYDYQVKGMQLFYGSGADRKLSWKPGKNKGMKTPKVKTYQYTIDKSILYAKNNTEEIQLEHDRLSRLHSDDKLELQDTLIISFTMNAKGHTYNHKLNLNQQTIDSVSTEYNSGYYKEESKDFVNDENKFRFNKEYHIQYALKGKNKFHGLPVASYSVSLSAATIRELRKTFKRGDSTMNITIKEIYVRTNDRIREKTKQEKIAPDEKKHETYYTYKMNSLGWILNNRFCGIEKEEQNNYRITSNVTGQEEVKIIFPATNSIMQGLYTGSGIDFTNIPANATIIVVGIRYNSNSSNYEFAMVKASTNDSNTKLHYAPVSSIEEMKKKIAAAIN